MTMVFDPGEASSYGEMKVRGKLRSQADNDNWIVPVFVVGVALIAYKYRGQIVSDAKGIFSILEKKR